MEQKEAGVTEHHDEEEYYRAIREAETATTTAVAEAVGVTRQGADYRLRKLRDAEKVTAKMVGNTLVWEVTEGAEE